MVMDFMGVADTPTRAMDQVDTVLEEMHSLFPALAITGYPALTVRC